ncbi:MAG: transglycosylase domain-containing protein [Oscillospiraceae bacterium]|nr:transglycosylase domain-containing protein [Oscillospiraceae bacterium]
MNGNNDKSGGKINEKKENELNKKDNISKTKKKQPSKFINAVTMIFYVNFKILSYMLNIALTLLLIGIITGGIVAGAFVLYINEYIDPVIDELAAMSSEVDLTTVIYYYDYGDKMAGTNRREVEMDTLRGSENRLWVKYREIEKTYLVEAFLALEDHRFFTHNGVDWRRTLGAAANFLMPSDGRMFGGSTITQQLVKMMTEDDDIRIQRKIQEMFRAMYLENTSSKEQILETYLNTVNLSSGAYGVQAAAHTFFNKDVTELNLLECAAIAAIVQSPTAMSPIERPNRPYRNKDRRNECLKNMLKYDMITQEEFDEAYDKELLISRPENTLADHVKSYFVDQIINDVTDDLMAKYSYTKAMASNMIYSGGLKIYSTMDKEIQDIMEHVYANDEFFPKQSEGAIKYQSSMVVLDPYTGELKGIIGGRGDKVQRGLNRASGSWRQPGSAIKPVSVYAPALDRGIINWGTPLDDSPAMELNIGGRLRMWPTNYPEGNSGYITLPHAMRDSKNTTAVKVLQMLSPEYSFSFMHDDLNIKSLVERMVRPDGRVLSDIDVAPLSLGGLTTGVSVYDLTAAYMIFANKGIYSKPRSYTVVKDSGNNTILDNMPDQRTVISEETAVIMTKLLSEVVRAGTASGLQMRGKIDVAGKTGTTNDDCDRWFIGYTPYYVCGVWFGYDQPKYLGVNRGAGNPPMMLFHYVMDTAHRELYANAKRFEESPSVITAQFCRDSGMAPGPDCSLDPRGARIESGYYARGSEPVEPCTGHVRVAWDQVTGAVAGPGCPPANIKYISLIRNDSREWPQNAYAADAQYTYRDVGEDYVYPSSASRPFYHNLLEEGYYSGTSGVGRPVNSFCVEHNPTLTWAAENRPRPTEPPPPPVTDVPETRETRPTPETTDSDLNPGEDINGGQTPTESNTQPAGEEPTGNGNGNETEPEPETENPGAGSEPGQNAAEPSAGEDNGENNADN